MRQWLFSKEELEASPSRADGLDAATEDRYRREGCRFILDVGNALSLTPNPTLASACVYFQRFYVSHSFKEYHRYLTAVAAMFLAGKVEETPKKCRDLIDAAVSRISSSALLHFTRDPKADLTSPLVMQNMKEEVMSVERVLLQTIKFDLQVVHPYQFLLQYAKIFKADQEKKNKMVQMAWTFVNDSLSTTLCLQWEPEVIAIALIYLASRLSKMDLKDYEGRVARKPWWELYVSDITMKLLEEICHLVLDLYSSQKSPKGPPPPPSTSAPVTPSTTPRPPTTPTVVVHNPASYFSARPMYPAAYAFPTSFPGPPQPLFPPSAPPSAPPPPPPPGT